MRHVAVDVVSRFACVEKSKLDVDFHDTLVPPVVQEWHRASATIAEQFSTRRDAGDLWGPLGLIGD